MKEEKSVVFVNVPKGSNVEEYQLSGDSIEGTALELFREFNKHGADIMFTFEAVAKIPETQSEKDQLDEAEDDGKYVEVDGHYFKANLYDGCEGPDCFADKFIDIVRDCRQVYLKFNSIESDEANKVVKARATIDERDYTIILDADFDDWGAPWRKTKYDHTGRVIDDHNNVYNLDSCTPGGTIVPGIADGLWFDVAEIMIPNTDY